MFKILYVEANLSTEKLPKKILEAQVAQWNYILGIYPFSLKYILIGLVVGKVEQDGRSVNVRIRDDVCPECIGRICFKTH